MHSRMCFVDRPVHIEKGYEYVHTQTRHASWLFSPSWSKHIQNKSLPYGAGNTLKLLNQVIHFGFSGAKRGEWGNDPIHDYEKNHPSNPHSLPSTSKSSGIWIHHLICCLPSWVHTLLGWPQWRGGKSVASIASGFSLWGFWTCCWWSRPWCSIASFSKQVRGDPRNPRGPGWMFARGMA